MATKILIVEDKEAIARRLTKLIDADPAYEVVATAADIATGKQHLAALKPSVVLVDLGLPDGSGLEIIKACKRASWECRSLVLSVFGDEERVISAIRHGASGYLQKGTSPDEILRGIKSVLQGGAPISPQIARHLLQELTKPAATSELAANAVALTPRELDVLQGLSLGYKRKEVAEKYGISVGTVSNHINNIFRKLEVNSNHGAVAKASQMGLL